MERFIVNTHHCPEAYLRAFPQRLWRGVPILFRHEQVLLDTGGGLKNIEDLLDEDEAILCYNGDILTDLPLDRLLSTHQALRPEASLVLRSSGPLLNVNVDEGGRVCDLRHTLGRIGVRSCLFAGISAIETSVLRFLEPGRSESIIPVFVSRIVERPGSVMGVVIDEGQWNDVGSLEIYEALQTTMVAASDRIETES